MAHRIQAIVAGKDAIERFARRWPDARPVYLPQEIALCMVSGPLKQAIEAASDVSGAADLTELEHLSAPVADAVSTASTAFPVAYIETNYTQGVGTQAAVVFDRRELCYGPRRTIDTEPFIVEEAFTGDERAVNGALRYLGVWKKGVRDEWDMLGLYNYRHV